MGATTRPQPDARASGTAVDSLPAPPEVGDFDVRIAERAALLATRIPPPYEPATLREKIHASLQRPGLARVDVLYLHQWQESALRPDTLAALQGTVADDLVGALGVSNFNVDQLGRADRPGRRGLGQGSPRRARPARRRPRVIRSSGPASSGGIRVASHLFAGLD